VQGVLGLRLHAASDPPGLLGIDLRDPADIQLYIDGANVLPSSVFKLDAGTGPIGLLVHLEKTSGTATAGPVYIDALRMLTAEQ